MKILFYYLFRWGIKPSHEALKNGDDDIIGLFKKDMKESDLLSSISIQSPS